MLKKIDPKLFGILSTLGLVGLGLFLNTPKQLLGLALVHLGTLAWLASFALLVNSFFKWSIPLLAFKLILFFGLLTLGWQLMEKKLFIALLNLPLQALVLAFSAKVKP